MHFIFIVYAACVSLVPWIALSPTGAAAVHILPQVGRCFGFNLPRRADKVKIYFFDATEWFAEGKAYMSWFGD